MTIEIHVFSFSSHKKVEVSQFHKMRCDYLAWYTYVIAMDLIDILKIFCVTRTRVYSIIKLERLHASMSVIECVG